MMNNLMIWLNNDVTVALFAATGLVMYFLPEIKAVHDVLNEKKELAKERA